MNIMTLAINYGTTHFVSFGDVLMRGIFLPAMLIFCVWGFIKVTRDLKDIDYDEPFEEENQETRNITVTVNTCNKQPSEEETTKSNGVA